MVSFSTATICLSLLTGRLFRYRLLSFLSFPCAWPLTPRRYVPICDLPGLQLPFSFRRLRMVLSLSLSAFVWTARPAGCPRLCGVLFLCSRFSAPLLVSTFNFRLL